MQVGYQHPPASLPSYQARCGHKLQLPSWGVQQHGHASPRCMSDWRTTPQSLLEVGSKNVDSCQHKIRDSHHMSQQSYQRSITNKYHVDQSTCHKCFKAVGVLHSASMHHSQGRVVPITGFPGCYSVPLFIILPCTHKVFFLSFC